MSSLFFVFKQYVFKHFRDEGNPADFVIGLIIVRGLSDTG